MYQANRPRVADARAASILADWRDDAIGFVPSGLLANGARHPARELAAQILGRSGDAGGRVSMRMALALRLAPAWACSVEGRDIQGVRGHVDQKVVGFDHPPGRANRKSLCFACHHGDVATLNDTPMRTFG